MYTHSVSFSLSLSLSKTHTHTHAWKHLKRVSVHIWCLRTYIDDLEAAYECTNVLRTDVWNRKKVTYIILKIANFAEPSRFATFRRCKIKYQRWGNYSENVLFLTGFPYWSFLNHKNWLDTSCYLCSTMLKSKHLFCNTTTAAATTATATDTNVSWYAKHHLSIWYIVVGSSFFSRHFNITFPVWISACQ